MTMKKILLIILFLMAMTNIKANEIALDGFALGESANSTELADISSVRELVGGTIFDITYEGAWNVIKKELLNTHVKYGLKICRKHYL